MTAIRRYARRLRQRPTDAERSLWYRLRARDLSGLKFRRQVPLGRYIADFASFERRLVIELDGGQHADGVHRPRDEARDRWFNEQGFTVLRFWNSDVLQNMDGVLLQILDAIGEPPNR